MDITPQQVTFLQAKAAIMQIEWSAVEADVLNAEDYYDAQYQLIELVKAESRRLGRVLACSGCDHAIPIVPSVQAGRDHSAVTCENPACYLHGHTFTVAGYYEKDRSHYTKTG